MEKVAVVGSGTMGSGVGYVTALAGFETRLYDVSPEALVKAEDYHRGLIAKSLAKERITAEEADAFWGRMSYLDELGRALDGADIVIEAIPEDIELKKDFFRQAEGLVSQDTILGSNTSSLPITQIASAVESRGRVIGIHFFNPAPLMKLVEIIVGMETEPDMVDRVIDFVRRLGKEEVVVNDFPGFVTTRVGIMLVSEAIFALQEGVAEKEALDKAIKLGYNHPMGPLALADLIGLDIVHHILEVLHDSYKDPRYRSPILLKKMVEAGRLGRKTGRGFYEYE
ncbi:MAG: 3-hydroxyacyl-CoA dehydrogenase family protein [Chloroflexi bacterium]|nr:3-hydroxyacyl-CoA dehydrogenase family protein [Chloroflexota bacterium]